MHTQTQDREKKSLGKDGDVDNYLVPAICLMSRCLGSTMPTVWEDGAGIPKPSPSQGLQGLQGKGVGMDDPWPRVNVKHLFYSRAFGACPLPSLLVFSMPAFLHETSHTRPAHHPSTILDLESIDANHSQECRIVDDATTHNTAHTTHNTQTEHKAQDTGYYRLQATGHRSTQIASLLVAGLHDRRDPTASYGLRTYTRLYRRTSIFTIHPSTLHCPSVTSRCRRPRKAARHASPSNIFCVLRILPRLFRWRVSSRARASSGPAVPPGSR